MSYNTGYNTIENANLKLYLLKTKKDITALIKNYSPLRVKEYLKSHTRKIQMPENSGLKNMKYVENFRDEEWFEKLTPEKKEEVETIIAEHIQLEIKEYLPKIYNNFYNNTILDEKITDEKVRAFFNKNRYIRIIEGYTPEANELIKKNIEETSDDPELSKEIYKTILSFIKETGLYPGSPKELAIDCAGYADFATIIYNIFGYNTRPIKIHNHTATIVKVGNNSYVLDINYRNKLTDLREWIKEVGKTPLVGYGNNIGSVSIYNLGWLLYYLKFYIEAVNEYRKVIEIDPNDAKAHNNLGALLQNLKRYEEAEKEYREAIKIYSYYDMTHNNLGILLHNLERYEETEKEFREAIKINPNYANAHYILGFLLEELKRYEEAAIFLKKALQINPEFKSELCEIIEGLDKKIRECGGQLAIYTGKTMTM